MLLASAVGHGRRRLPTKQSPFVRHLGPEPVGSNHRSKVYLLTFARVLAERLQGGDVQDLTALTGRQVLECALDA